MLDTFLMGHPSLCVSEENPLLQTVSDAAKELKRLPDMPQAEVDRNPIWPARVI